MSETDTDECARNIADGFSHLVWEILGMPATDGLSERQQTLLRQRLGEAANIVELAIIMIYQDERLAAAVGIQLRAELNDVPWGKLGLTGEREWRSNSPDRGPNS